MTDQLTIVLRVFVLMILAITSQLALHRRKYALMLWTLGFWLTICRIFALRVLRVYAHQDDMALFPIEKELMYGWIATFTDIVLVLTAIPLYVWITKTYKEWKEEVIKRGRS